VGLRAWWAGCVGLLLTLGCAPGYRPPAAPSPADIPVLEARVAEDGGDLRALISLGAAYRAASRLEEAELTLERALVGQPEDADAVFHLGLTYEDLERYGDARVYYQRYLEVSANARLKGLVEARLRVVERQELLAAVRESLRLEGERVATPPRPHTVAVFPFLFVATNPDLEPLSRALSEFMVTDLGQTDRLTVLERARVQLLIDEMELADAGIVEPATAARSGRLLGAGQIVQGRISGDDALLGLEAIVVEVEDRGAGRIVPVREEDALARLFEMEKNLVFRIYQSLGVELTPAERERIGRRPTENLRAVLEFGRGLAALDAGRFGEAARHFNAAAALDPEFGMARTQAARSAAAATAVATTTGQLAAASLDPAVGATEVASAPGVDFTALEALIPGFGGRNPVAEVMQQENFGGTPAARGTFLRLILKLPVD
jgi:tetratricopeptide (TPR) repeat protein